MIAVEYHKARASTNYSFHVIRYLPEPVAVLMTLYLIYIRPFAKMLFNNTRSFQQQPQQKKKDSRRVQKQAGQRRKIRRQSVKAAGNEDSETYYYYLINCF